MAPGRTSNEPLIVVCGHRTGSSLFMSLLVDAGLYVDELLPPAPDNPVGFFESREVVEINTLLMAARERDWTCPPSALNRFTVDLAPLRQLGNRLREVGLPWGFKDPRTLFTLPIWSAALGTCRIVGVHRNSTDVARSLAGRSDFTFDQARDIACAYAERLAELHRRLGFPIVSFDVGIDEFIQRAATIAGLLGLRIDTDAAMTTYRQELVHHRSDDVNVSTVDEYLAQAAVREIRALELYSPHTIISACEDLPSSCERLPRDLGPRYKSAREAMLRRSVDYLPEVGNLTVIESANRTFTFRKRIVDSITVEDVRNGVQAAGRRAGERWSHVAAPTLLDEASPAELPAMLDLLVPRLEAVAMMAVSGWIVDSYELPSTRVFEPSGVKASRYEPPYLHHLDEIATALMARGLYVAAIERAPGGRVQLFLTNDRSLQGDDVSGPQLRATMTVLQRRVVSLEDELTSMKESLDESASEGRRLAFALDERQRLLIEADEKQAQRDQRIGSLQQRLCAVEATLTSSSQALGEAYEELNQARDALTAAWRAHERLAGRRSVRLALVLARPMRPVYRAARRLRGRGTGRPASARQG